MSANEPPHGIDLEALGLSHMARYARAATFAPNWKSVLAADAFVGIIITLAGLALALWVYWLGWVVVALGAVYLVLVLRRGLQWRWLRKAAGL